MAKRLSKTLWYGTGLDAYGKPLLPPVATNESDLNGLHRGELFMHLDKKEVTLWALSSNNEVVQIAGKQGEIDIDLSDYLLKSTWDKVWELRKDNNGVEYIYSKLPVITRYGITMYADNGEVEVEPIYAGLPIDRQTLIWKDGVLMVNPELDLGGGGGIDENGLRDYLTRNDYAKKSDITTALSGYATTSSLNAVSTKLNDFLEGSDTDTVINKWKELEIFLSGLTESDNLATILTGKADKSYVDTNFVTIAGTEDVTGLHNFVNGLKVGGLPITKKQDDVVYLDANLVVRGGITMYGYGEGGSSVPSYSTLGSLLNVDESNDAVASVDRVLFQSAGSNVWSWKPLSEIGGGSSGGGSVSGDYLPLSGGTINGAGDYLYVPLLVNALNNQISCITFKTNGTERGHVGYHYELGMRLHTASTAGIAVSNSDVPIFYTGDGSVKNTILHAGNYSSYALPLSGGTLTGTLNSQFVIPSIDAAYQCGTSSLRWDNVYSVYGTFSTSATIAGNTVWHAGNDGSGSGLDADLLDGVEGSKFYREQGRFWSSYATSVLGNGSFYAQGYSPVSGAYTYGSILNFRVEDKVTQFYITDGAQAKGKGGRIFFRDSWNAQESISTRWLEIITSENIENQTVSKANQLTTARTIWGQSFDGTGNITTGDIIAYANSGGTTSLNLFKASGDIGWQLSARYGNDLGFNMYYYDKSKWNVIMRYTTSGNVGIGTTSPQAKLSLENGNIDIYNTSGDWGGAMGFNRKSQLGGLYNSAFHGHQIHNYKGDLQFYIEKTDNTCLYPLVIQGSTGYIGVNETNPSHYLHVKGNAFIRDGIYLARSSDNALSFFIGKTDDSSAHMVIRNTSGGGKIIFRTNKSGSVVDHFVLQQGSTILYDAFTATGRGKFGDTYLSASGAIGFNRNTDVGGRFNTSYNGWQFNIATSTSRFEVYTEGTNSGIKSYWDTSGNFLVSGGITMYSDQRKKTILNHVELSLKQIADAPLIEHYYNSDQEKTTHVGSIAQYWANLNDWFCKLDAEGFYTMEIQNCALASAISIARHLEKYESKTDKKIRMLKKRVQELEEEVERLKQN